MIPRYTRPEMGHIWSDDNRFAKWLEVELAAADALGVEAALVVANPVAAGEQLDPAEHERVLAEGLERAHGKSFRWAAEYSGDMNEARTLDTQLNVFEQFSPKIPAAYRDCDYLFLANIHPKLQLGVRRQLPEARLVAMDTMNFWIKGTPEELNETLANVHMVTINETETRMLAGCHNLSKAAKTVQKLGPGMVIVKRGEYGVISFNCNSIFFVPAYPLEEVFDPTGAGDSFAGGFMGHLAQTGDLSERNLRRAMVYGSVMASFAVEDFGLRRTARLTRREIDARFREFKSLTHFDV